MKRNLALFVTIAFLSVGVSALADNGPAEVKFENKRGTVTFNHLQHQDAIDCAACHHNGLEIPVCRSCHDGTKAPLAKTVFHNLCKDCHKKSTSDKVKGECAECHKK
jgi:hypothetical protein